MFHDWLIKSAAMVNEGRRFHADLPIKDGRNETMAGDLVVGPGDPAIYPSVRGQRMGSYR